MPSLDPRVFSRNRTPTNIRSALGVSQGERMPRLVRLGGTIVPRTPPEAIYLTFKVSVRGCSGGGGGAEGALVVLCVSVGVP